MCQNYNEPEIRLFLVNVSFFSFLMKFINFLGYIVSSSRIIINDELIFFGRGVVLNLSVMIEELHTNYQSGFVMFIEIQTLGYRGYITGIIIIKSDFLFSKTS